MTSPTAETVFDQLVGSVPAIADAAEVSITNLPGGLSNTNYVVDADGAQFVVRIGCDNREVLGIDRSTEEAAARAAHAAGFSPEILEFTQPDGHAVSQFLPNAPPLSIEQFVAPSMIRRVAALLRDVHALPPIGGRFDPYAMIARWSMVLNRRGTARPSRLERLFEMVAHAQRVRPPMPASQLVVCHNDPYHLNFLDDGSLWLIDWEYAGMGDPMYDLAGIGYTLDGEGRDLLLEAHFGSLDQQIRHDLDALIPVYLCWNVMWSLIQVDDGVPGFDYFQMANDYLDLMPGT